MNSKLKDLLLFALLLIKLITIPANAMEVVLWLAGLAIDQMIVGSNLTSTNRFQRTCCTKMDKFWWQRTQKENLKWSKTLSKLSLEKKNTRVSCNRYVPTIE